ncbi:MAG: regulatory protein RecX [Bacillota bacterium]
MEQETLLKKARSGVFRLLTYRDRSISEVSEYLDKKNYPENIKDHIINEMIDYGYLDDRRFAENLVSFRKASGHGLLRVRFELQQKGVNRQVIDELIDEKFNREEDIAKIKELLCKREPVDAGVDHRWINRQAAFLKRRGFQDNLIMEVLKGYNLSE